MQRMDYHSRQTITAFRDNASTPSSIPPSAAFRTGDGSVTAFRSNDTPATMPPTPAPGVSAAPPQSPTLKPNEPGKKPYKWRWWQLLCYMPWMLWMIGHNIWDNHHVSPNDALVQAAQDGNLVQVQSALSHGAAVDATCPCNRSAFDWACFNGHAAVASYLLSRGASVNHVDDNNDSALTLAASKDRLQIVGLLVAHSANVNQKNDEGTTSLWSAVNDHQTDEARMLLDHGASPNVVGKKGWTMLMQTAKDGNTPLVRMLLAHRADVAARYQDGTTAYDWAVRQGHSDIAALLKPSANAGNGNGVGNAGNLARPAATSVVKV